MRMREQVGYRDTQTYTLSLISLIYIHICPSVYLLCIFLSVCPSHLYFIYQIYHYPEVEGPSIFVYGNADGVQVLGPQALDNADKDGHHLHQANLGRSKEAPQSALKR